MGFGKRLRRRISKHRRAITAPVRKALTPIVGKKIAGVVANPGGAVLEKAHGVTSSYGKFLGTVYGVGLGGLVGARTAARRPDLVGGTGAKIGRAAIQIEKPLLGVAGGLIAGGVGSGIAGAIGEGIAPGEGGGGQDFDRFDRLAGADSSPSFGDAPTKARGDATLWILVGLGAVAIVGILIAFTKKRR